MKWHKSFYQQVKECKKTGNRFRVKDPFFSDIEVIVCVEFKTHCHSKACLAKRKEVKPCHQKEN